MVSSDNSRMGEPLYFTGIKNKKRENIKISLAQKVPLMESHSEVECSICHEDKLVCHFVFEKVILLLKSAY